VLKSFVRISDTLRRIPGAVRNFSAVQSGQDAFEYLLVIGGVSVAVVVGMVALPGIIPALLTGVCSAISTTGIAVTC
jgi:Flp pilus assembly pilin Flp